MQNKKEIAWRKKLIKELKTVIKEDYGDEPEEFNENDMRCQAWKAYNVLRDALK